RARELYTKVVRNAIAYGASAWYIPSREGELRGIASRLLTKQSRYLRTVTGTYLAIPIYCLEQEVNIPPLDIYLYKKVADFEARLQTSGIVRLISNSTATIASWLRRRRHRPKPGFYPYPEGAQRK